MVFAIFGLVFLPDTFLLSNQSFAPIQCQQNLQLVSQGSLSDPVEAGGSAGAASIAFIHPSSYWFFQPAEGIALWRTLHRLRCLHSESMTCTVALSAGNK